MQPRHCRKPIRHGVMGVLTALAVATASAITGAQSVPDQDTTVEVGRALEHLPHYGVFDYLAFRLDSGLLTVRGFAYGSGLDFDAVSAAKHVPGVLQVAINVQALPVSREDDRIRWMTFHQIYTDYLLAHYAPGGAMGARFDAFQFANFPPSQPSGYPIHIVVMAARTTLAGTVNNAGDKQMAEMRARQVGGVREVNNELVVQE